MQILHPELTFIYGPMGSAKTSHLIISAYNCMENGLLPLIFTSSSDTRSHKGTVQSRISGLEAKAKALVSGQSLFDTVSKQISRNKGLERIVFIDESHFLSSEQVDEMGEIVDNLGLPVFAYGLKTDFRTELFPASARLLSTADRIQELEAICPCGAKASANARVLNGKICSEGPQFLIGGNETYIALCRKCFRTGKVPCRA